MAIPLECRRFATVLGIALLGLAACDSTTTSQSQPTKPAESTPVAVEAQPKSDWTVLPPQVDRMDGTVSQFVTTGGPVTLDLCFENGKPCKVAVDIHAPKGCYIEGNFDDWHTRRKVRVKFDDDKARREAWIIADSHDALIPLRPTAFIWELKKHKTLLVEFGCAKYDEGEVVELHINGLQEALDSLKQSNAK